MFYHSDSVTVKSGWGFGIDSLIFEFRGKLKADEAKKAIDAWRDVFEQAPAENKYVLIWDCTDMTGFDISAKNYWQDFLNQYNDRIEKVVMISDNIILRGAARLILRFAKFDFEVVKSFGEMKSGVLAA